MEKNLAFFDNFMFRAENGDWFIKPVCDFFGLDYDNQFEKITKDKICQTDTGKFPSELVFADKRLHSTLRNRGFSRWIQMINTVNIRVQLREKFEIFQANIFDYLWIGNIQKTEQLEDIRTYASNISSALKMRDQTMGYVAEQRRHQNLCLTANSAEWSKIKATLIEEKSLPEITESMKAIGNSVINEIEELIRQKHNHQTNSATNTNRGQILNFQTIKNSTIKSMKNSEDKTEKATIINGVVLTADAIDLLQNLQRDDNGYLKEIREKLGETKDQLIEAIGYVDERLTPEFMDLIKYLTIVSRQLKDLMKP